MTDGDEPTTSQEDEVRRLLADARHTGPPPPEVVARLDSVLEDLASEPDRGDTVVDLARRRRRAAALLVAAAAVVVVGIGAAQLVTPDGADTSAESTSGGAGIVQGESQTGPQAKSTESPATAGESAPLDGVALLAVRPNRFVEDVTAARSSPSRSDLSGDASSADRAAGALCSADAWGTGRFVAVRYGDQPAVVVFRRPVNETQVADLFLCGSEQPVRSVTLPAP